MDANTHPPMTGEDLDELAEDEAPPAALGDSFEELEDEPDTATE